MACTKCGKIRNAYYRVSYGFWGRDSWMCRYCARQAVGQVGGNPERLSSEIKIRNEYFGQDMVVAKWYAGKIPKNDWDEEELVTRIVNDDMMSFEYDQYGNVKY